MGGYLLLTREQRGFKVMLSIWYGEMKDVAYGPVWFKYAYEKEWLSDPFVQEMMEDIDHSCYIGGMVIESDVLGPIPPETLSGGLKTLIMIYKRPDMVFDATSCGPNCAKWLLEIGKREDVTVNLRYFMPLDGFEPFSVTILNVPKVVSTAEDFAFTSLDYLP